MQGISKTLKFVAALAVILGIAGYYVYYTYKKAPEAATGIIVEQKGDNIFGEDFQQIANILKGLKLDTAFLADPTFTSLEDFYRRPPAEEAGLKNPFTAF